MQAIKKVVFFLEGAQFAACLFPLMFSKSIPPVEYQYRTTEQHTDRWYPAVSMLFLFSLHRLFPSVACFRCRRSPLYRRERGKVFGRNTLCTQRKIPPETAWPPDLYTFNEVCTNFHGRRGNRRLRNGHWLSWPESARLLLLFSISLSISLEIFSSVILA